MAATLVIVYQIDKHYKKNLTANGKSYSILKGGVYDKK
jgi:hypothetical protein